MRTAVALILVLGSLASAQVQLHTRVLLGQSSNAGTRPNCTARLADLDGDGLPDLIAGSIHLAPQQEGVALVSGATGTVFRLTSTGPWVAVEAVAGLDDVNGDGVPDYACGMPHAWVGSMPEIGSVKVFSGATGALLSTINGTATYDLFGWALSGIGDQDGDGLGDILVGAPQGETLGAGNFPGNGYVRVVSGATGATIRTLNGFGFQDFLGNSVARLGDLDGDGTEDFVAGAPEQTIVTDNTGITPPLVGGYVRAFSGATGAVLYTVGLVTLSAAYSNFGGLGFSMAPAGDLDGDGKADFVSAAILQSILFVFSGATGAVISTITPATIGPGAGQFDLFGSSLGAGGDVNGDGVSDVIVGAPAYTNYMSGTSVISEAGHVSVYSWTGALLATLTGSVSSGQMGKGVAIVGDQNGDGFAEVAICSYHGIGIGYPGGTLHVAGLAIADRYGGAQPLALAWTHAFGSIGVVTLSGAPAGAPGVLVASSAPASTTIGGLPVLVALIPGQFSALGFAFPASGALAAGVDLRVPGLAGFTAYLQGAALPLVSNGLSLSFAP